MSSSEADDHDDFQQKFGFQNQMPNIPDRERIPLTPSTQKQGRLKQWKRDNSDVYIPPLSGKTLDEGEVFYIRCFGPCFV